MEIWNIERSGLLWLPNMFAIPPPSMMLSASPMMLSSSQQSQSRPTNATASTSTYKAPQRSNTGGVPEGLEAEAGLPSSSSGLVTSLADSLRTPEDLSKLPALRKRLRAEKARIDAELNAGVMTQLEETREGLRRLMAARNDIGALRDEMISIERSHEDPSGVVGNKGKERERDTSFSKISKVATIHRNLSQTAQIVSNLRAMSSKVHQLSIMLESDRAQGAKGPSPNLLIIHYQLNQLEGFRNETMHLAKKGTGSGSAAGPYQESKDAERKQNEMQTLIRWFERLDDLTKEFEDWLWELASNVIGLVREGNGGTVVRLLKIIDVESKEDQKAVAMRLVRKVANADQASKFRSMQANARVIKNYRHKLLDIISASIKDAFKQAMDKAQGDYLSFIEKLGWIYQDLLRIESDVVPLFPEDYEIFPYYVKNYHKTLDDSLQKIVNAAPEAGVLLRMHAWVKEYRSSMKELEIPAAWLQPPLLGGKSQDLIEDYVKLIVTKIDEWSANLMKTERRDFSARDAPPEQDSAGMYGLQYAVILFQMVNQQVDLAADSGQGAVLARVVSESGRVMRETQQQWTRALDAEFKRQIEKPEEVPAGLVEYVIALANDQLKSADYCEALSSRLEPLVSDKYKTVIVEKLNEAIDGYLDVAKRCTQVLIDLVFNDLKGVAKALFTPAWYTDSLVEQIVETMRDYMADYQAHLNASIFDLLVADMLVEYLSVYLNALRRVSPRAFRMPAAIDRMSQDSHKARSFFSQYKNQQEVDAEFEVIDAILAMLSASSEMIFMDYWSFAKVHGPNLPFIEAVIKARDDLDKATLADVIETLRRKTSEEGIGEPEEPTIMVSVHMRLDANFADPFSQVRVKNVDHGLLSDLKTLAATYAAPYAGRF